MANNRRGGIDYSKWDHIGDSSSDDDEPVGQQPRVTRLDAPSRITTTPDGTLHVVQPVEESSTNNNRVTAETTITNDDDDESSKQHQQSIASSSTEVVVPASWTTNGGHHVEAMKLYWCQDRQAVSLRIQLPPAVKTKKLTVDWSGGEIYSYANRHAAVGSSPPSFTVRCNDQDVLFQGDLPHPIHLHEGEDELDWQIENDASSGNKYLLLVLPKASPMTGLSIQWKRPLKQVPEQSQTDADVSKKQSQFQQAWDEAHTKFREKVAKGELRKPPPST